MRDKLRVGAVSYMNARPLIWGLEKGKNLIDLHLDIPSRLYKLFEEDKLDIALLPAIAYIRNASYRIIPDISISSKGAVESVNLFLKRDINDIKEVAIDMSSLTSRALTSIILQERYGLRPQFIDWDNGLDFSRSSPDALLLIGDNAMIYKAYQFKTVLDLGNEWHKLTGLPFVYAFWVTRAKKKLHGLDKALKETKEAGLKALEEIAGIEAKRLNFPKSDCLRYLSSSIHYDLGESEIKGLKRFYSYAIKIGLVNQQVSNNNINKPRHDEEVCIKFYGEE